MARYEKISYPDYLNEHGLSEQELALLSEQQRPLAKDWSVTNKKLDWLIRMVVDLHNMQVDHETLLDTWRKVIWLAGVLVTSVGVLTLVLRFFRVI